MHKRLTTLPPSCAIVKKSGNLNFLEPSGTLRACNGTALPSYEAYKRESSCIMQYLFGNLKERDHLEGVGLHGRIILKWILNNFGGRGIE